MQTANEIFQAELDRREIGYQLMDDGLYEIRVADRTVTVSLDNIRRNYERDGDADAIRRFVDNIGQDIFSQAPTWEEVQPFVRYSLEPSDYQMEFDDILCNEVNEELKQVFVYMSPDGSRITWVNKTMLDDWGVTREQVVHQAEQNMAVILAEATFEVEEIRGSKLGMISTKETPFKASLILSPSFREFVSPTHGWPVYVVVPCRDFTYVIPESDHEFLGYLGRVVVKEYHQSGHPITKDVLQVSDQGVTAIGTYPDPE